jgi:predicted transcriptional regulator
MTEEVSAREGRIAELIAYNNAALDRARKAENDMRAWQELALTSGRKLARLRETITELANSSGTVTMSTREVRQVLLQRIFARLINVMDEKD